MHTRLVYYMQIIFLLLPCKHISPLMLVLTLNIRSNWMTVYHFHRWPHFLPLSRANLWRNSSGNVPPTLYRPLVHFLKACQSFKMFQLVFACLFSPGYACLFVWNSQEKWDELAMLYTYGSLRRGRTWRMNGAWLDEARVAIATWKLSVVCTACKR